MAILPMIIIIIYWQNLAVLYSISTFCRQNSSKHYTLCSEDQKGQWISTDNCPLKLSTFVHRYVYYRVVLCFYVRLSCLNKEYLPTHLLTYFVRVIWKCNTGPGFLRHNVEYNLQCARCPVHVQLMILRERRTNCLLVDQRLQFT